MCGIAGYIDYRKKSTIDMLDSMAGILHHRGPDNIKTELYYSQYATIGFGHTRLSILDLSAAGNQPMHYNEFSILLNGEIYNYKEIRDKLIVLGHSFVSDSDTEVVLKAFSQWGYKCVHRFIGMFAFTIYDRKEEKVYACKDRVGVKPLYYYWKDGLFLFASELKAFHKHPGFDKQLDKQSVSLFFQYSYIPGTKSIFKFCSKLEPGHWLTIDLSTQNITTIKYWDVQDYYTSDISTTDYQTAKIELEVLLKSACNYRLIADVPVGIFLSGGYDSTTVAALLQKDRTQKLKTFTIGFPDGVDEAPFAREIARHLGTDHTEHNCTEKDAQEVIKDLAFYYDEPCADISAIPTIMVSRMAKSNVTVALSADGGDEIFAGYSRYKVYVERLKALQKVPFKKITAFGLSAIAELMPYSLLALKHKLDSIGYVLKGNDENYMQLFIEKSASMPDYLIKKILNSREIEKHSIYATDFSRLKDPISALFVLDFKTELSDILLVKVDRAAMSASLETREPLLDHRIIEYAARLPFEFKHDGRTSKRILRDIVHQYVPKALLDRPKTGFDLPIFKWLKGDLSYLMDEYLNERSIKETGIFNHKFVSKIVVEFRSSNFRYAHIIWRLLQFQMWHKQWM